MTKRKTHYYFTDSNIQTLYDHQEELMSSVTDLSATVASLKTDVDALVTMVQSLQTQLTAALAQVGVLSATDQTSFDSSVTDLANLDSSVKSVLGANTGAA